MPIGVGQRLQRLREGASQIAEHPGVLRPLPGKQHGQRTGRRPGAIAAAVRRAPRLAVGMLDPQGAGGGDRLGRVGAAALDRQHQPAGGVGPPGGARLGGAATQFVPRQIGRPRGQLGVEGGGIVRAEGEQLHVAVPIDLRFVRFRLFEDAMEIAAAEAEGADAGPARMVGGRQPRPLLGVDVERRRPRLQSVERPLHLDRRRQDLVMQGQRRLDETGRARRRLGVADLRLHRSQRAPRPVAARLAVDLRQRRHLGGVADARAGAVRLDQLDRCRASTPAVR